MQSLHQSKIHGLILDNIDVHLYPCPKIGAILLILYSFWYNNIKVVYTLYLTIKKHGISAN